MSYSGSRKHRVVSAKFVLEMKDVKIFSRRLDSNFL